MRVSAWVRRSKRFCLHGSGARLALMEELWSAKVDGDAQEEYFNR